MTCTICKHGETGRGKVTVMLQRRRSTVIIKGVPGDICGNCGEYYLGGAVTDRVLALAEEMRGARFHGSFIGIGGADFGSGERLSPAVEAGLPAYAAALADEIRRLVAG